MKKTPANPFQPGNTFGRGRPQGSRNKSTIALQEMLDGHGEAITRKCALLAMQGDPSAMRLCMERLIPPRKDHPVQFRLPPIGTAKEVAVATSVVLLGVAAGELTPAEGHAFAELIELRRRAIETEDHDARIYALETDSGAASDRRLIFMKDDPE
jgi:hypothetical protein